MRPILPEPRRQSGFTLIEAITAIVITGIIAAVVAVFIKGGVGAYFDTARRAELTDIADTALRRLGRELRLAVPNSVRITTSGGVEYIEMLETKAGGRYDPAATDVCFTSAGCTSISTMGSVLETVGGVVGVPAGPSGGRYLISTITGGTSNGVNLDQIVLYNQYNNSGGDCSASNPSAYCGHNLSALASLTPATDGGSTDAFSFTSHQFVPAGGSPSRRFQIIEGPVTYACNPTAVAVGGIPANSLRRYSKYNVQALQPTAPASPLDPANTVTVTNLIATNVSACAFTNTGAVFERWGVVQLYLALTEGGETVSLYHEVHINNVP